MLTIIKSMCANIRSCVHCTDGLSDFFDCPLGVRQGCCLSPILFSLFISELYHDITLCGKHGVQLHPDLTEVLMLLFADDVILVSDTVIGLQNQLNILESYSKEWKLSVNISKTEIVIFRRGGPVAAKERWFYDGELLNVSDQYTYLGFLFSNRMNLNKCTQDLALRGKKALIQVMSVLYSVGALSPDVFFKMFNAQIQPILLYGSEIWGFQRFQNIEKIHLLACKKFLNVNVNTSNCMVYGECGRFPLYINSQIRCLKFWMKIIKMHEQRLPKLAYNMLLNLDNLGYHTWATDIRNLLFSNGFGFVWLNQTIGDVNSFLAEFRIRSIDIFKQNGFQLYIQVHDMNIIEHLKLYFNQKNT